MKPRSLHALLLLCLTFSLCAWARAEPHRIALLVGVGNYAKVQGLEGPANDVASMRDVLVRRWGFAPGDIHVLVDAAATRAAVLRELSLLEQRSAPGDEILVYFSGHGTSAIDASSNLPLPYGSGAYAPVEFDLQSSDPMAQLIVGRRDLRPALTRLDNGGRHVWVISDSCYSGQLVRSAILSPKLRSRMLPLNTGKEAAAQRADQIRAAMAPRIEPYPYHNVVYLAAASEGEQASDIPVEDLHIFPTLDGRPHGALTDALLRVLEGQIGADFNGDGQLSLNEVHRAVSEFMATRPYDQTPQRLPSVAEDQLGMGNQAVLSTRGAVAPVRTSELDQPLRVHVAVELGELAQRISGLPSAQVVPFSQAANLEVMLEGNRIRVYLPGGSLVASMAASDTGRALDLVREFAWTQRLSALARRNRRAPLAAEISPAVYGGKLMLGQTVDFVVRPDRDATVLVLNIDSNARVSVLYPRSARENQPLRATRASTISGTTVSEPIGTDFQFYFAFDTPPEGMEAYDNIVAVSPEHPQLARLLALLSQRAGQFSFAQTELRTLPVVK